MVLVLVSVFGAIAITDSRPCVVCPPSMAASYFLLLAQKKVTKEKGTLAAAVAGASMPLRLREQATGFA
jgi:hypothetical protein